MAKSNNKNNKKPKGDVMTIEHVACQLLKSKRLDEEIAELIRLEFNTNRQNGNQFESQLIKS